MSTTIPGGAYQGPSGSWHDANGQPLKSDQIARYKQAAQQRQDQLALAEQQRMATEASGNPIANALMQALGLRSSAPVPTELDQERTQGASSRGRGARSGQVTPPGNDPPPATPPEE